MPTPDGLDSFATLRAAWPEPGWTWDGRLECVTSSVASALAPRARAALLAATPAEWTVDSLPGAPDAVSALARRCGGLRSGQMLFAGEIRDGMFPFALWWPWGDGSKVSVRLGVASPEGGKAITPQLRALFELS